MENWKVDMDRLIELIAERMYSDPIKAGLREIITNSLDARVDNNVHIEINYYPEKKQLVYIDNGKGIDPLQFKEIYGVIASDHTRSEESRGFFGMGRMVLIAASDSGIIRSFQNSVETDCKFTKKGFDIEHTVHSKGEVMSHGIVLRFEGIDLGYSEDEIVEWLSEVFTIPLYNDECSIIFNWKPINPLLSEDWNEYYAGINKKTIDFFTKIEPKGTLYICQKGILVKKEAFTGVSAWINQDFLDIKTDREGFVNNELYRKFKKLYSKHLSSLRPKESIEKMEIDFIDIWINFTPLGIVFHLNSQPASPR